MKSLSPTVFSYPSTASLTANIVLFLRYLKETDRKQSRSWYRRNSAGPGANAKLECASATPWPAPIPGKTSVSSFVKGGSTSEDFCGFKIVPTFPSNSPQYNHCYESEIYSLEPLLCIYKHYPDLHIL